MIRHEVEPSNFINTTDFLYIEEIKTEVDENVIDQVYNMFSKEPNLERK